MKKSVIVLLVLFWVGLSQGASAKKADTATLGDIPVQRVDVDASLAQMPAGLNVGGCLDLQVLNMVNRDYTEGSVWYGYPVYRLVLAPVMTQDRLAVMVDLEKPGYANRLYPFVKINQLYGRVKTGPLTVQVGRQQLGDVDNLFLGMRADALRMGMTLGAVDLEAFYALTEMDVPWSTGGEIESMAGFLPTVRLGKTLAIHGYALAGMESITITSGTPAESRDAQNYLILLGGRTQLNLSLQDIDLGFDAQAGYQMAVAKTGDDDDIDASGLGAKVDASYHQPLGQALALTIKCSLAYTSGDPEPSLNTTTGFSSLNQLPGSGPGLFAKLEDGAGSATFVDSHAMSPVLQSYSGVIAAGVTAEVRVGSFEPGLGFWHYLNTDENGEAYGMEFNEWLVFHASEQLTFFQQAAVFVPNSDGIGWSSASSEEPKNALKFLIGTSIRL